MQLNISKVFLVFFTLGVDPRRNAGVASEESRSEPHPKPMARSENKKARALLKLPIHSFIDNVSIPNGSSSGRTEKDLKTAVGGGHPSHIE